MALTPLLVDAKKEYTHQLADVLAPYVMNTFARMYEKSKQKQKVFRELLRQVPNWNTSNIDERTGEIERRNPQLQDLVAACCVSYTKVLGSIRLNQSQRSNVRVELPTSSAFVHGVYVHVAKEFFYEPKLVYADRHTKTTLMRDAVEESVRQHVPIRQLLRAYLDVAVDDRGMDPLAAADGERPTSSPPPSPTRSDMGYHVPQPAYEPPPPAFQAPPPPAFQAPPPAFQAPPPAFQAPPPAFQAPPPAYEGPPQAVRRVEIDQRPEFGDQRPEFGDQRPEFGDQRPEFGDQRPEFADQRPEFADQRPFDDEEFDAAEFR